MRELKTYQVIGILTHTSLCVSFDYTPNSPARIVFWSNSHCIEGQEDVGRVLKRKSVYVCFVYFCFGSSAYCVLPYYILIYILYILSLRSLYFLSPIPSPKDLWIINGEVISMRKHLLPCPMLLSMQGRYKWRLVHAHNSPGAWYRLRTNFALRSFLSLCSTCLLRGRLCQPGYSHYLNILHPGQWWLPSGHLPLCCWVLLRMWPEVCSVSAGDTSRCSLSVVNRER